MYLYHRQSNQTKRRPIQPGSRTVPFPFAEGPPSPAERPPGLSVHDERRAAGQAGSDGGAVRRRPAELHGGVGGQADGDQLIGERAVRVHVRRDTLPAGRARDVSAGTRTTDTGRTPPGTQGRHARMTGSSPPVASE